MEGAREKAQLAAAVLWSEADSSSPQIGVVADAFLHDTGLEQLLRAGGRLFDALASIRMQATDSAVVGPALEAWDAAIAKLTGPGE